VLAMQRRRAFGLGSGSCLVSFHWCNPFISGSDYGTFGGVLFVWVRVVCLFVSFVLIYLSQVLNITRIVRFLDFSRCILYRFIVL